ncbi:MAG: HTH domain-containing protein, partial [Prevotella sp.]|nr:HTH domain-containing protein [Prevotella sp.]
MRNDRLSRELDIILMLAGTDDYTVDELCREAKVSRRTLYYYIECLRECGFDIYKS